MGGSDTEASTGTSSGRGRPRRNVNRPAHLSGKRGRKTNPARQTNNQDSETGPTSSNSARFLRLVLEKLDDQATAVQHLQQHADRREQEQIKELTGTIESMRSITMKNSRKWLAKSRHQFQDRSWLLHLSQRTQAEAGPQ